MQLALDSAKTVSPAIATDLIELSGLNLDPYIAVGFFRTTSGQKPSREDREKLLALIYRDG